MPVSDIESAAAGPAALAVRGPRCTAGDLLALWEASVSAAPAARPTALLDVGGPWLEPGSEVSIGWAAMPLGERDQWLLRLRRTLFGRELTCHTACPACGEALELALDVDGLLRPPEEAPPPGEIELSMGGEVDGALRVTARLPTGEDLRALAALVAVEATAPDGAGDPAADERWNAAARRLAERCLLRAERDGVALEAAALSDSELAALEEALAAADPRAELRFRLACEECGDPWSETLDIAAYLAAELEIAAHRLLRQVATLARGFGWRESDVLALSPLRRRAYLDLLGA